MEKFNRAERRHQDQRLKDRRLRYWSVGNKTERTLGMLLHSPALCSCWMCGNPRKFFGQRTIKEEREAQRGLLEW